MKALVPERAMVPRLFTRSALVMPMPESMMVRVLLVLSGTMWMNSSGWASRRDLSVRPSKRILSRASEELLNLGLEGEGLGLFRHGVWWVSAFEGVRPACG